MKNPDPQALLKGLQLFQLGKQFHAAKDFARAADAYRKAMSLMPDHPQLLINFGQLAEDVSDWKNAEKIYRHLHKVKPIDDLDGKIQSIQCLMEKEAGARWTSFHRTYGRSFFRGDGGKKD